MKVQTVELLGMGTILILLGLCLMFPWESLERQVLGRVYAFVVGGYTFWKLRGEWEKKATK